MKTNRFTLLLSLSLGLLGCEERIEAPSDGKGTLYIINSQMCSLDSLHSVRVLASSEGQGVVDAGEVSLKLLVNGVVLDEVRGHDDEGKYELKGSFLPGDNVCVSVTGPLGTAAAEAVVPDPPATPEVTYDGKTEVSYVEYGNAETNLFNVIKVKVKDAPGEHCGYRVRMFLDGEVECIGDESGYEYPGYSHLGEVIHVGPRVLQLNNRLEPLLCKKEDSNGQTLEYNVFPDYAVDGQEYSLLLLTKGDLQIRPSTLSGGETWVARTRLVVRFERMTELSYRYLNSVYYETDGNWIPLNYQAPVYPSNVEGGLGYLLLTSAKTASYSFSDRYFDDQHYLDGYVK